MMKEYGEETGSYVYEYASGVNDSAESLSAETSRELRVNEEDSKESSSLVFLHNQPHVQASTDGDREIERELIASHSPSNEEGVNKTHVSSSSDLYSPPPAPRPTSWECLLNSLYTTIRPLFTFRSLILFLLGQFLSLTLAIQGVIATILVDKHTSIPLFLCTIYYIFLIPFIIPYYLRWKKKKEEFRKRKWQKWIEENEQIQEEEKSKMEEDGKEYEERERRERSNVIWSVDEKTIFEATCICQPVSTQLPCSTCSSPPSFLTLPWYAFFILAIFDVEANFIWTKSYQFTTLLSVQLLDGFTIPCAMLVRKCLFNIKFHRLQLIGCATAMLGMILIVISDAYFSQKPSNSDTGNSQSESSIAKPSRRFFGDMLVLIGCIAYAGSTTAQETAVKKTQGDLLQLWCMLGCFGYGLSLVHFLALELPIFINHQVSINNPTIILLILAFGVTSLCFATLAPVLLRETSAVFLNLSLLSADFWSLLCALFIFHLSFSILTFFAFVVILLGILIYHAREEVDLPLDGDHSLETPLQKFTRFICTTCHRLRHCFPASYSSSFSSINARTIDVEIPPLSASPDHVAVT